VSNRNHHKEEEGTEESKTMAKDAIILAVLFPSKGKSLIIGRLSERDEEIISQNSGCKNAGFGRCVIQKGDVFVCLLLMHPYMKEEEFMKQENAEIFDKKLRELEEENGKTKKFINTKDYVLYYPDMGLTQFTDITVEEEDSS
jgi:hypothetical protein